MSGRGVLGLSLRVVVARAVDEHTVFDFGAHKVDVARAFALRLVHQLVRALNQIGGQPPRDEAPIGHPAESQADDADVDTNRLRREPLILERPVVPFHRLAEALADGVRLRALGEVRYQEAEFVAAEPGVKVF